MALEEDSANGAAAIANAATPAIVNFVPEFNVCSPRPNRSLERTGGVQTVPYHEMTRMCLISEFSRRDDCINGASIEKASEPSVAAADLG
jgi:hypothetical protein